MADIAAEYADALYRLALEEGIVDEIARDLRTVDELLRAEPDYVALLSSPAIPADERIAALNAALGDSVHEYVLSTLAILCKNGRMPQFGACAAAFDDMYMAGRRVARASVVSAAPLTDAQKARLQAALEARSGRSVEISYAVDPSLIGGITVEMDGRRADGSVRRELQSIKDVIKA